MNENRGVLVTDLPNKLVMPWEAWHANKPYEAEHGTVTPGRPTISKKQSDYRVGSTDRQAEQLT